MTAADACLFCQIVAGEVDAEVVLDEADFVGFLDIRPVFKGHVLLVPREHVVTLPDLPAGLRDGFLEAAQRLATAVVAELGAQGSFVAMNNVVSQSVPHLHLHVVPRTKGDGLRGLLLAAHHVRRRRGGRLCTTTTVSTGMTRLRLATDIGAGEPGRWLVAAEPRPRRGAGRLWLPSLPPGSARSCAWRSRRPTGTTCRRIAVPGGYVEAIAFG